MEISRQEEIIAGIWAIAAILSFGFGYPVWGWIFAAIAWVGVFYAIATARSELQAKRTRLKVLREAEIAAARAGGKK